MQAVKQPEPQPEPHAAAPPEEPDLQFRIAFKRRVVDVHLPPSTTVGDVQAQLERHFQIEGGRQKLLFKGKRLAPEATLGEAGVTNKAKLMLMGVVDEDLRRTVTSETYERLLASPELADEQRSRLAEQQAALAAQSRPVTEMDVFLERTESRRKLAAARKELEALKYLAQPDSDGLRRSKSEVERLRAVALEQRTAAELAAVKQEVAALRDELGLDGGAGAPTEEAALASELAAGAALTRTASMEADEELQMAIALSLQAGGDSPLYSAPVEPGALYASTTIPTPLPASIHERNGWFTIEGLFVRVRQSSAVAPDGAPVVPDAASTARSAKGDRSERVAVAAELAAGDELTRTASAERGMAPPAAGEGRLVRQRSAVAPDGAPITPDAAATATSPRGKKAGKKRKKKGGKPSYKQMMAEIQGGQGQTAGEKAAEARARLAHRLAAPENLVRGEKFDRI